MSSTTATPGTATVPISDTPSSETVSQFGRFIENGACFEAHRTPHRRWMNVHHNAYNDGTNGSLEFYSQVSQYGDGPINYRLEKGKVVNIVGWESTGLYVRDDESGRAFSPGGSPLPTPVEELRIRYRAASTEISSLCDGIHTTQRIFVPLMEPVQVWTVELENRSDLPRALSVFAAVRFALGGGPMVDVHPALGGVFARRYDSTGKNVHDRAFLCVTSDFAAATGHREDLFSPALEFSSPRLLDGCDLSGVAGDGFNSVGGVQAKITIEPGTRKRLDFLLGHATSLEKAISMRDAMTTERIDALLDEVVEDERERAGAFSVDTGHPNLDAVINHFAKKQMNVYLVNKSGYRDNLQVGYALAMADEDLAERALLRALSAQHPDGWAPHRFRPLTNVEERWSSDPAVWIFAAVSWHIKQTGDFSLLEKVIPYQGGTETGTVWDHVLRAMRWLVNDTRSHGLCDLRDGDWNDGLSPEGDSGGRESVMVSQQLCHGLLEVEELARRIGDTAVAEESRRWHTEFARRINEVAWDGEWYQRVLCDDGFILGTHKEQEGQIFQNAQSWAILGQVAPPDRAEKCMDSLEKHLALDIGYRIVNPPFSKFDPRVGHSATVPPGIIENGGCYNHASGFKGVADCLLGRAENAWRTFRKVAPDNPDNPVARSHMEPFAFSNLFFADEYHYGRSLYAWTTGTGPWFTVLLVEYILGVRRDYDGLLIDPCLSREVPRARVVRRFRGATFDIHIDNTAGRCTGVRSITVDGEPHSGAHLPDFREGRHVVEVII